jgi:hypothetical protein
MQRVAEIVVGVAEDPADEAALQRLRAESEAVAAELAPI